MKLRHFISLDIKVPRYEYQDSRQNNLFLETLSLILFN